MQVALTRYESELSQYIHRAILMAPCIYLNLGPDTDEIDVSEESMNEIGWLRDLGVYAYNGPNWENDLQTICDNRSEQECNKYTNKRGPPKPVKE